MRSWELKGFFSWLRLSWLALAALSGTTQGPLLHSSQAPVPLAGLLNALSPATLLCPSSTPGRTLWQSPAQCLTNYVPSHKCGNMFLLYTQWTLLRPGRNPCQKFPFAPQGHCGFDIHFPND